MRHRFLAAALLLASAPVAAITPSLAQTGEDTTTAVARARFKEGVEFYDKGDFERARASFLQAYALKKHPAVLLNLAWSCLKSGHPLESERYFREFPTEGKEITDKQRADAADGLAQSRARLGHLEVVALNGADVTIDGDRLGAAPLADALLVEPGAHTVKVKNPDGTTDVQSVTVLAGERGIARFTGGGLVPNAPIGAPPANLPVSKPAALPREPPSGRVASPTTEPVSPSPNETSSRSHGFFPANMVPVYLGGILTLAGTGVAIVMLELKQTALDNANATGANIRAQGHACPPPSGSTVSGLADACSVFADDNSQANTDATLGNIGVGVAVVGLVGTVTYWIFADKKETAAHSANATMIVPMLGRSVGGLSVSGEF